MITTHRYSIRDAQHKDRQMALTAQIKDLQEKALTHEKIVRAAKESREIVLNDWRKAGSDLAVERKRAGERDSEMQVSIRCID